MRRQSSVWSTASRPTRPEPLFREFVGAAASLARSRGPEPAEDVAEAEAVESDDVSVQRRR